ncbi:hypothetical protein [Streptomyces sp. CC224B]|uniref:hypothetical protein n=1 Tax=Streptomyces sp. CC224B TaxID=3044571 RepID=UPI0024A8979D|nr:hypothetical protein [Streptomyces sp. CC224B]
MSGAARLDAIGWRTRLDPAEREQLVHELSRALRGHQHEEPADERHAEPADEVLDRLSQVLTEYGEISAIPDRIRPGDHVTVQDFDGGGA